jgi:hypothetical protein
MEQAPASCAASLVAPCAEPIGKHLLTEAAIAWPGRVVAVTERATGGTSIWPDWSSHEMFE